MFRSSLKTRKSMVQHCPKPTTARTAFAISFLLVLFMRHGHSIGPADMLGTNRLDAKNAMHKTLNLSAMRCGGEGRSHAWWDYVTDTPKPGNWDQGVKDAWSVGIEIPVINPIQYKNNKGWNKSDHDNPWSGTKITVYEKWHALGRAIAQRFSPGSDWNIKQGHAPDWGVRDYVPMNEPGGPWFFDPPLEEQVMYDIVKGFADGVHSVDSSLRAWTPAYAGAGATRKKVFTVVLPLINDGTLYGINFHEYYEPRKGRGPGFVDGFAGSTQGKWANALFGKVRDDCRYACTEFNVRRINDNGLWVARDEEWAAKAFMAQLFNHCGLVNSKNQPVCLWQCVFKPQIRVGSRDDSFDENYGFTVKNDPWQGTGRGKVLQMVVELTRGMDFTNCDPMKSGTYVLSGSGKKMWVWQNWTNGWTDQYGTAFIVEDIPPKARTLQVYRSTSWDQKADGSGIPKPYRKVDLKGETSYTFKNLPKDETLIFMVEGFARGKTLAIPGRIEAEDFNEGLEGKAYHDNDRTNNGKAYRPDGVDVKVTGDSTGGGYDVGWTANGEWLEYTIATVTAGTYDVKLRVGSNRDGAKVRVLLGGKALGAVDVPNLGNWSDKKTVTIQGVKLAKAKNAVLRLEIVKGGADINWIEFVKAQATAMCPGDITAVQRDAAVRSVSVFAINGRMLRSGMPIQVDMREMPRGIHIIKAGRELRLAPVIDEVRR